MRQSIRRSLLLAAAFFIAGCERSASTTQPATQPAHGAATQSTDTIVCLSPAASELLVAMGLQSRIVGVSGYEANETLRKNLPNAGDYQRIDWERLDDLKPRYLIIQGRADRLPGGIAQRCRAMRITPIVLNIDRFGDIQKTVDQLGQALNESAAAKRLNQKLSEQLATLQKSAVNHTPALIVLNEEGTAVVGRDNFINDALEAAGGQNVITASGYPSIDKEKFLTLHPAAIFLLLPDASDAVIARAKQNLTGSGTATANLFAITNADVLIPGTAVIDLAKRLADDLKASGK